MGQKNKDALLYIAYSLSDVFWRPDNRRAVRKCTGRLCQAMIVDQ